MCFYVDAFSYDDWKVKLRNFLGNSAETMITQEIREGKYNKETHAARFAKISNNWDAIIAILVTKNRYKRINTLAETIDKILGRDREDDIQDILQEMKELFYTTIKSIF